MLIWKIFAYLDLVGEDGIKRVERYSVPASTRRAIIAFAEARRLRPAWR